MSNRLGLKGESPPLRVRLPEEMLEELRKLADAEDRTLSNYARKVLKDHLESRKKKGGR